jgi:hypothetical protein
MFQLRMKTQYFDRYYISGKAWSSFPMRWQGSVCFGVVFFCSDFGQFQSGPAR